MRKTILFLVLLFVTASTFACTCKKLSVKKSYTNSNIIFVGRVVAVNEIEREQNFKVDGKLRSFPYKIFEYTFELAETIKGYTNKKSLRVFTESYHSSCGFTFELNKDYLVYSYFTNFYELASEPVNPFLHTDICTRTKLLSETKKSEFKKLYRYNRRN